MKGPLGCLAFLVGAITVFAIFLPPAAGNAFRRYSEEFFDEHYEGSLEVKEAWLLSFYGPQRIDSLVLRDPEGREVFSADVRAPSIPGGYDASDKRWGPIEVDIRRIDLVRGLGGSSNLSRAMKRRNEESDGGRLSIKGEDEILLSYDDFEFDVRARSIVLTVQVGQLNWSDKSGRSMRLLDVSCDAELRIHERGIVWSMKGRGTIENGAPDGFGFQWEVGRLERAGRPGVNLPWTLQLELGRTPIQLLQLALEAIEALPEAFGTEVDGVTLTMTGDEAGQQRVEKLEVRSSEGKLTASGMWRGPDRVLVAEEPRDVIHVDCAAHSWWTQPLLAGLPLMEDVRIADPDGRALLEFSDYEIPLGNDGGALVAACVLHCESLTFAWPEFAVDRLALPPATSLDGPIVLQLDPTGLVYDRFQIPTQDGVLEATGTVDMKANAYELVLSYDGKTWSVRGDRAAPELVPAEE